MRQVLRLAERERRRPGVLTISVAGGFPYSDVRDAGLRVLVSTAGDEQLAREVARRVADEAWRRRAEFVPSLTPVDEAVRQVKAETGIRLYSRTAATIQARAHRATARHCSPRCARPNSAMSSLV